jgi:hypothetical protein
MIFAWVGTGDKRIQTFDAMCEAVLHQKVQRPISNWRL